MKVILAKKAGFCMGVRRAVETTLATVQKGETSIATFGPLIHNPQVLGLLKDQGVGILEEIPEKISGTVIIRAHGVPPSSKERLLAAGAEVKDATCPRVMKVQAIIKKYKEQNHTTIIIGDKNHAEVLGLMGYAEPDVQVVSNEEDIAALRLDSPYIIVSQTTQDEMAFTALSRKIMSRFAGGKVFNTICDSTHKRQDEVRNLSRIVQAMVVVGGKGSANTQRLGQIAEEIGCPVFMAETENDLDFKALSRFDCVGVTAGASTPTWMINRIVRALESVPGHSEGPVKPFLYRCSRFLLASNLYISVAGGLLALVASLLLGVAPEGRDFLIAFGYLFAMHNMNRYADYKTKKFNDPHLETFWTNFSLPLIVVSALTLVLSIFFARQQGTFPFLLLLVMSILGILYNVPFIPKCISDMIRVKKLKEIPGSKTFFVPLAWSLVVVLIPAWETGTVVTGRTLFVLVIVALFVFVRNALFDLFDVQGDRIVGKETLPVCIGEKKTASLIRASLIFLAGLLGLSQFLHLLAIGGIWLLLPVLSLFLLTWLYETGKLTQGPKLEFWLESHFYLIAACIWLGSVGG